MLKGKTVLLGVTGGIAAYKMAGVASRLTKEGCDVQVILTKNAQEFITPLTFEAITHTRCITDTFDRSHSFEVEHISLAKKADLVLIAPATANVIGKLANGVADDMLTTTVMACKCPKLMAPAMNTNMYENPVVQDNLSRLRGYGWTIVEPQVGRLACGDVGAGKLADEDTLYAYILQELGREKDMRGLRVLVTAGATAESIDPVRFLTNHSTGKMGCAVAKECALRGARVTLVAGRMTAPPPAFVEVVPAMTAEEMFEAVTSRFPDADIVIKAAAVADYRTVNVSDEKVKKKDGNLTLELERTRDILQYLGDHKQPGQFVCGFSMETQSLLENSRGKLSRKKADMMVANNLKVEGAGFGGDTNVVTILTETDTVSLQKMSKAQVAAEIVDHILQARS